MLGIAVGHVCGWGGRVAAWTLASGWGGIGVGLGFLLEDDTVDSDGQEGGRVRGSSSYRPAFANLGHVCGGLYMVGGG
jgi:hypothetical protein